MKRKTFYVIKMIQRGYDGPEYTIVKRCRYADEAIELAEELNHGSKVYTWVHHFASQYPPEDLD